MFEPGDAWYRTGDLMRQDARGYFYFVDRIGDTFRWKGENVATSEVAEAIGAFPGIKEATVYGVAIPGTDGKAGMAAIVTDRELNLAAFRAHLVDRLPDYARPVFLRIRRDLDVTDTFKHTKNVLVREGYDPVAIGDAIYFNDRERQAFVRLDKPIYDRIQSGRIPGETVMKPIHQNVEVLSLGTLHPLARSGSQAGRSVLDDGDARESDDMPPGKRSSSQRVAESHRPVCRAGGEFTCVRLSHGTALCTGRNQFGQLGNGTLTDSWVLGPVSGLTTVTRVAAGDEFACALLANGTARCWGLGETGQRGDNASERSRQLPVTVFGLTGAVGLAGGYGHACALLNNATLRCWGENREGQLGNGTTANPGTAQPVTVSGITTATAVTTGAYHTCALLTNGTVRCWGRNNQGQLGNGTDANSSTSVAVSGLTGVAAVSGGGVHTCAVLTNGTVRCWGENEFGQLGNGSTFTSSRRCRWSASAMPLTSASGGATRVRSLATASVRCWGENAFGQLGNGSTANSTTPVPVSGISGAVGVTAGWWHHSCALLGSGTVRCWGQNDWGQFGNDTTTDSSTPVTMQGTGVAWTSSNTAVATINAAGLATGVSPGTTTITATDSSGANGSTTLTVSGQPSQFNLSVVRSGAGTGTVTSSPSGINCGTDCSESYNNGSNVTLTAAAGARSTFAGWNGCDTVSGTTCTVTMNAAKNVTATFNANRADVRPHRQQDRQRHRHRDLESVGNQLRRGLLGVLQQRHQRDLDAKRRRRFHLWQLERLQHRFRYDVFRDHERGEDGHRHVQSGDR